MIEWQAHTQMRVCITGKMWISSVNCTNISSLALMVTHNVTMGMGGVKVSWDFPTRFFATSYKSISISKYKVLKNVI